MSDLALVTGGAGFIGSNLVGGLLERGLRVRVLDDLSTGRESNLDDVREDVDLREGDVRDLETVRRACEGAGLVFHEAAIPSVFRSVKDPLATNEANVTGTLNVLVAARDTGARRVVFASSSAVYGEQEELPVHEGMVPRPISPYGVSKLAGERYLHAFYASYGLPTVALRYFNVYGPRQDPNTEYAAVVPRFVAATLDGRAATIFGDGDQVRDFIYVSDVVRANLIAAEAPEEAWGGAFNIAVGEARSVNELLATIHQLVPGDHEAAVHDAPRPGDVRESRAAVHLAAAGLGFRAEISLEEGLKLTVDRSMQRREPDVR